MENVSIREMASPVSDIENLRRELEQIFAATQTRRRETQEKTGDTSGETCLVVKGK